MSELIDKFREIDTDESECADSYYQQFIDLVQADYQARVIEAVEKQIEYAERFTATAHAYDMVKGLGQKIIQAINGVTK